MPYYITKTNGDPLVTVEDGTIDTTTTDLALLGKNYPTYGLSLNENFVKLLENFANIDQPATPLYGQTWYDSGANKLNLYRQGAVTDTWKEIATITESDVAPTEMHIGDLWYDTAAGQLKVYDGTNWITIGPQTTNTGLLRISGTNTFTIQIGGTTVFTADNLGNVNKPLNASVQAYGHSGGTDLTTSGTTSYTLWIPQTVTLDNGGNFSAGIFTCPAAGIYRVHANLVTLGKSGSAGAHYAQWRKNNLDSTINAYTYHQNTSSQTMVAAGLIKASAGDVITLVCSTDVGASISHLSNSYSIEMVS
jgi:hypothetical protein